jgi:hypothetical protein
VKVEQALPGVYSRRNENSSRESNDLLQIVRREAWKFRVRKIAEGSEDGSVKMWSARMRQAERAAPPQLAVKRAGLYVWTGEAVA